MPSPDPDTAIRRLVAELASLHADDIGAILDGLAAAERQAIEGLLQEYADQFQPAPGAPYDLTQLSAWLQQLAREASAKSSMMTPVAQQALLGCITALYPAPRRTG
jgi:hypothetical protein